MKGESTTEAYRTLAVQLPIEPSAGALVLRKGRDVGIDQDVGVQQDHL